MSGFFLILSVFFFTFTDGDVIKNIEFRKKNFPDKKSEYNIAVKNLEKGNYFFEKNRFSDALPFLNKANEFNPDNVELNYKIAVTYLNTDQKARAIRFLQKAKSLDENITKLFPLFSFWFGEAFHYNSDWDNAINEYQRFLNEFLNNSGINEEYFVSAKKKIEECKNGKDVKKDSIIIVPVKNINSEFDDHTSIFLNDSNILFTSRRNFKGDEIDLKDNAYYESIYSAEKINNEWQNPKLTNFKDFDGHYAVAGFSQDGKTLLVYNNGDILESVMENNDWTIPRYLSVNTSSHESSGWLCSKCKTILITIDLPGGIGGKDIYISHQNEKGKWEPLMNLGLPVNTLYDEEGVFVTGDTIYFASKGHNSIGGYDIFKTYLYNMKWSMPENLGSPINTPYNDLYYYNNSKNNFFITSDRPGNGGFDIFSKAFPVTILETKNDIVVKVDSVKTDSIKKDTSATVQVVLNSQELKNEKELSSNENKILEVNTSNNIEKITKEIKSEIAYCVVQVGAFKKITSKKQFIKEYDFHEYSVYIEKEGELNKFIIKKKFYNKGGENLFDSNNKILLDVARIQMRCKKKYKIPDVFIAVYDKNDKRIALIMDVPKMKYKIF